MAEPYVPPTPTEPQPHVPTWIPPPPTDGKGIEFAQLHTIELNLLEDPDPAVVQKLVETAKIAIKEDGFLYLTNYGVSLEQLHRQFSIGQYTYDHITEEEKERLKWNPQGGSYAGYKAPFGWRREKGAPDGIEQFNFYKQQFADLNLVPSCLHPLMEEIAAFVHYLTTSVNRRLLKLFSLVLELPPDWLYENIQSRGGIVADSYFRHALFRPLTEDIKSVGGGALRMNGHTDYGTTTLLFSVPVSSLQIWGRDNKWRYVGYNPGALVINIGETLEIISGGHFKATRHRVVEPPEDQRTFERLSLVLFNASESDMRVQPAYVSPLIQREGCIEEQGVYKEFKALMDKGFPVPTNREWRESQIASIRQVADNPKMKIVLVNGVEMSEQMYHGVKVLLPV
ncbi:hypothetical protein M231_00697 [Tremella mesenterica]|uniref:Fe2OG dioxygenase domain-containing protein n=1 Tax=Tremella mesenterica TaxID=5217 RepID=A0A4Q1BVC8_TREME|nr:hypothetical protein M231_00697 [Tremella mesenterica]